MGSSSSKQQPRGQTGPSPVFQQLVEEKYATLTSTAFSDDGSTFSLTNAAAEFCTSDGLEAIRLALTVSPAAVEGDLVRVVIEDCALGYPGAAMISRILVGESVSPHTSSTQSPSSSTSPAAMGSSSSSPPPPPPGWVSLSLRNNQLGGDGVAAVAAAVAGSPAPLEELYLGGNLVGEMGLAALVELVGYSRGLRVLDLSDVGLGGAGMAALTDVLGRNRGIESLDLGRNGLGGDGGGVPHLAEVVELNSSITHLGLTYNGIKRSDCVTLLEAIRQNESLTSIDLEGNAKAEGGADLIADHMRVNATLGDSLF